MPTNKAYLRKVYKEKRKNMNDEVHAHRSQLVAQQFFQYFQVQHLQSLHLFLPIQKLKELNTWYIVRKVWQAYPHLQLVVSVSDFTTLQMKSFYFNPDTPLKENTWGIPEVVNAVPFPDENIAMILLPLLAFDLDGYRVGYGKGFYDRFLQRCPAKIRKVGLSLEAPIEKINDTDHHDVRMDYCVTPERVYVFDKQ
ncbi:MAG: 5-formyltetrahydrofolate cyclo-ligase [Thermonemataceae bacterium]